MAETILVVVEQRQGKLNRISWETLAAAQASKAADHNPARWDSAGKVCCMPPDRWQDRDFGQDRYLNTSGSLVPWR